MTFDNIQHIARELNVDPDDKAFNTVRAQLQSVVGYFREQLPLLVNAKMDDLHTRVKRRLKVDKYSKGKTNPAKMLVEYAVMEVALQGAVSQIDFCADIPALLALYPQFSRCTAEELVLLLRFRNYMAIAVFFHKADGNMKYLLDLCTDLTEGPSKRYITGSGASRETNNRVAIYRQESGISPRIRPKAESDEEVAQEGGGGIMYEERNIVGFKRSHREEEEEEAEEFNKLARMDNTADMPPLLGDTVLDDALFDGFDFDDLDALVVENYGGDFTSDAGFTTGFTDDLMLEL